MDMEDMEDTIQEIFDDLGYLVTCLILGNIPMGMGHIKNIGTLLQMVSDELGLDTEPRTPVD